MRKKDARLTADGLVWWVGGGNSMGCTVHWVVHCMYTACKVILNLVHMVHLVHANTDTRQYLQFNTHDDKLQLKEDVLMIKEEVSRPN